ncbi:MAG: hypothetical protein RQ743_14230, partial [Bacteroidales bacterium]|nr:hypothetical protein [Bacteroidales bacterium]
MGNSKFHHCLPGMLVQYLVLSINNRGTRDKGQGTREKGPSSVLRTPAGRQGTRNDESRKT